MKIISIFTTTKNAVWSFFSEEGKLSIKRGISALFAITLTYMVWFFLNRFVPEKNQETFKHCFDWLCGMIVILTGAATIKDIIALRNGTPVAPQPAPPEPTKVTTVTETTVAP